MAKSFSFDTGGILINKGYTSELRFTGTIKRTSATSIRLWLYVKNRYSIYANTMKFHVACGNTNNDFDITYPDKIHMSGWKEITNKGGHQKRVWHSSASTTEIFDGKEFTVPADSLYFAVWFDIASYYHVMAGHQAYNVIGGRRIENKLDKYFTAPSNLKLSATASDIKNTSASITAKWTKGSNPSSEYTVIKVGSNAGTDSNGRTANGSYNRFTGLVGNTAYTANGTLKSTQSSSNFDTATKSFTTDLTKPSSITHTSTINSISVKGNSSNGTGNSLGYSYRYRKASNTSYEVNWSSKVNNGVTKTYSGLSPNSRYIFECKAVRSDISPTESSIYVSNTIWTNPSVTLSLKLVKGSEHNSIIATATSLGNKDYIQYRYSINGGSFSSYSTVNPKTFTELNGNTTYNIKVQIINTVSQQTAEASASITTWHNPLTNLQVVLSNKWYWYIAIASSYKYDGPIKQFEFDIYDNPQEHQYHSTGTVNGYSKGTVIQAQPNNLKYNRDYNCLVRITDTYGRVYTASKIIKTLDERPLYLNGILTEVKMVRPNNSILYITPNIFNVIGEDGTITHMNKIINNDDRTEFK